MMPQLDAFTMQILKKIDEEYSLGIPDVRRGRETKKSADASPEIHQESSGRIGEES